MIDKAKTIEAIDLIVGQFPTMESKLQIIQIDLLFEIREELIKLNNKK
jgi:hypothetical protein